MRVSDVIRRTAVLAMLALPLYSHAATLFSDLGPAPNLYDGSSGGYNVFGSSNGYGDPTSYIAAPFVVSGTGPQSVTQVDLAVLYGALSGNDDFSAAIYTDVSGAPGTQVPGAYGTATTTTHFNGQSTALVTFSNITGITLIGGTEYYLVVSPGASNTADVFAQDSTGYDAQVLTSTNGSTWTSLGDVPDAAFDVLGTPVASPGAATPEPSSLLLLATGLAGGAGLAGRRSVPLVQ